MGRNEKKSAKGLKNVEMELKNNTYGVLLTHH